MITEQDTVNAILGDRRTMPPGDHGEAFAPANIALCKYWGKRNRTLNLPVNGSLSVSLGTLGTRTRLRPAERDTVTLNGALLPPNDPFCRRVGRFLDLFRVGDGGFAVETGNTVPTGAGLASSASGFAALTLALDTLFGWQLTPRERSILARLGSGSACRSVHSGFVEWYAGTRPDGMDSFAAPLADRWPGLRVGVITICDRPKPLGSREAMQRTVETSPLYGAWPNHAADGLAAVRRAIAARDFAAFGRAAEANAVAMHAVMLAAWPPVLYWQPETVSAMRRVWALRERGVSVYMTMDAGPNVKLLYQAADAATVRDGVGEHTAVAPFEEEAER